MMMLSYLAAIVCEILSIYEVAVFKARSVCTIMLYYICTLR